MSKDYEMPEAFVVGGAEEVVMGVKPVGGTDNEGVLTMANRVMDEEE